MALADSLARAGASVLLVGRQRAELAALDLEEEVLRTGVLLVQALVAALLGALFLAALAATVVVVFWDSSRLAALAGVTLAFGAATAWTAWRLSIALRTKPPFMSATLAELAKDSARLAGITASVSP